MKAIQLQGFEGFQSLRLVDIDRPRPGPEEVLIEVKAAGLNYAELEQTHGRYPIARPLPLVMGFEAAGVVVDMGARVANLKRGDRIAGLASSGGFAEYATLDARAVIPIPDGVSFSDATTLIVQGLSAYALLTLAARPRPHETVLVQAAAGGVGLFLVQLAKLLGVSRVIALASTQEKLDLVKELGADVVINYSEPDWPTRVKEATGGKGVDVALEMSSGAVGKECFKLLAPFGRIIVFGAKNMHDTITPDQMKILIFNNQSLVCFNVPTLRPEQLRECVPHLLELVTQKKITLFAHSKFRLAEAAQAFEALASRHTIGKVVLTP